MKLEQIEQQVAKATAIPPVHSWSPALSGDIDIRIAKDGRWYHDGTLIHRERLVKLFSSILWREGDDYFLITPVEKWRIQVDEEPLLVVSANRIGTGVDARIEFETLTQDKFGLDSVHPLSVSHQISGEPRPVVRVRYELDALIHRNVFYQLVDWAEQSVDGSHGVWSSGEFFPIG